MSSESRDQNFNDKSDQEQVKTEVDPVEEKCDTDKISMETGLVKKENAEILANNVDGDRQCASEQMQMKTESADQNLNTVKAEIARSDAESIVENLNNALAEKVIKKNECDMSDDCNSSHTETERADIEVARSTEKLIRDTLVHKVNELDISGRVNPNLNVNKSNVILKKETDSLKNLLVYDNSSDDDDVFEKNWQLLTVPDSFSDSESDSNDFIESSSEDDTDDASGRIIFGQKDKGAIKKDTSKTGAPVKPLVNIGLEDPTPIPDLSNLDINYEKEDFFHMGHIQAIIDTLVTVEAIPGTPAYDLDSYLFIEDKTTKKPLGAIYDVIGPVSAPIYCIRFNAVKDIQDLGLKQGLKVFSAPKSQYTNYVFVKELMRHKGTDASWVGDVELPPEVAAEMSDDEDEHNLQNVRQAQKRKHGSLERHKQFEKSMNACNTFNTRVAQLVDAHRRLPRPVRYNNDYPQRSLSDDFCSFANRLPVPFDPSVPPPRFHDYRQNNGPCIRPPPHWGWLPHDMYRPPMGPPNPAPYMQGQNNSANYYTNNAGRSHAGPSTQPY